MIIEKPEKIHKIHGIKIGYSDKKITAYGGFSMIAMFFEKVGLKAALEKMMPITETPPQRNEGRREDNGIYHVVVNGGESIFTYALCGRSSEYKRVIWAG